MNTRTNRRHHKEYLFPGHLKLYDLKEKAQSLKNQYLSNPYIPAFPRPEFHVSHLKHDTGRAGLCGIKSDGGFKNPLNGSLVWWSLAPGPDEIASAERRLLEATYPDRTEEQAQMQQSFLEKFATSPAFEKTSRLGSYRFTFPLEEVLQAYSDQLCDGAQPIMRVFRTHLYSQEVMYAVLVHSPANQELYSHFPLLSDEPNSICAYRDGRFIWRSEAMCETHKYKLVRRADIKQMQAQEVLSCPQFYVWDHLAIALHVDEFVLEFDSDRLRENLKFCSKANVTLKGSTFEEFEEADEVVKELWPDWTTALERA